MTHYEVLGVERGAPVRDIRRAYLALARRHHPDRGSGDAERMARINAAWAVLGDATRRAAYDETLDPVVAARPEAPPWRPYDTGPDPDPMPAEDVSPPSDRDRVVTMLPAILFASAVSSLAVGLVSGLAAVLAFGIVCLVAAALSFVVVPVVRMFESRRDDPDRLDRR